MTDEAFEVPPSIDAASASNDAVSASDAHIAAGVPPRIWTPFVVLAVSLLGVILGQAIVGAVLAMYLIGSGADINTMGEELIDWLTDPPMFIAMALISQLIFAGVAIGAAVLSPVPLPQRLGLLRPKLNPAIYPYVLLSCIVPTAIGLGFAHLLTLVIPPDPSVEILYEKMTLTSAVPFILFIALAPGFAEELLFRGYCQRRWLERWSPRSAIAVTSVSFALFHIMPHAVAFAFPVGVWLGYVAWKTDSVWPSMACHAFVNGVWNILQIGFMFGDVSDFVQTLICTALLCLGLVGFVVTLCALRRNTVSPTRSGLSGMDADPDVA